jgi:CMP-N-acetylneuraminic acid synthetase
MLPARIPPIKALVPMKGHSERVPGKNIRPLCGKPLFHWIVEALLGSQYIDEIIIDTDSPEIADDAGRNFPVTLLKRPDFLLGDLVSMNEIIAYDLSLSSGEYYLQTHATNPLLRTETMDQAIETFFSQSEHDSLFSVTQLHTRLYWPDGRPVNHDPGQLLRTQDLAPIYEENSCIYLFSKRVFTERRHRLGKDPMLFPVDRLEAVDIDEEVDFAFADICMTKRLKPDGSNRVVSH